MEMLLLCRYVPDASRAIAEVLRGLRPGKRPRLGDDDLIRKVISQEVTEATFREKLTQHVEQVTPSSSSSSSSNKSRSAILVNSTPWLAYQEVVSLSWLSSVASLSGAGRSRDGARIRHSERSSGGASGGHLHRRHRWSPELLRPLPRACFCLQAPPVSAPSITAETGTCFPCKFF